MRTFVYQKERSCLKRRRIMRRLVDQNYRRCRRRERRMKRFANQTEPLPANKKRIEANKLSPEANTFSRGKVMVNLSHSKLKRKGHTEEKDVPAAKISRKQIAASSRKNSIGKNADALAFKEIIRSLQKVDKSQKIGNGTFGNCYIALYGNEYRVVAKEMKIIESPKKTRGSVARSIGNHRNWRPLANPSSVWCFHRSGTILSCSPVPRFA